MYLSLGFQEIILRLMVKAWAELRDPAGIELIYGELEYGSICCEHRLGK